MAKKVLQLLKAILFLFVIPLWIRKALKVLVDLVFDPSSFADARGQRVAGQQAEGEVVHPPVKGVSPVSHEFITTTGMKIHVARAGIDAKKPLLLFLHGFPEFWYSWREQLAALADEFEVAAPDMPGYNLSDKPKDLQDYQSQRICAVLEGVLAKLGRNECVLIGHDWGAAIAWDFAALFPHKVTKLAVLSVVPGRLFTRNLDLGQLFRSYYMFEFLLPRLPEMQQRQNDYQLISLALGKRPMGVKNRPEDFEDMLEHYKNAFAQPGAATAATNYYRAAWTLRNPAVKAAWKSRPQVKVPVLFLGGDGDVALSHNLLTGIGDVAPNAHVQLLPNCSHWVQQDCPGVVNTALRMFVKGQLPLQV